jgi:Na+/melibiose symporter-like transporter
VISHLCLFLPAQALAADFLKTFVDYPPRQKRRASAVAVKMLFYGIASLLLGYVERFLEALHKVHNFDAAFRYVFEHASQYRLLAWAQGIGIVFVLYFAFVEINERMDEGELWRLFFESPKTGNGSGRRSNIIRGKRRS